MSKSQTIFFCQECGGESSKWQGQCGHCLAWNTLVEAPKPKKGSRTQQHAGGYAGNAQTSVVKLSDIKFEDTKRLETGLSELDRVLGGGLVPGSAIVVGGSPGAGKSTLLLQLSCQLSSRYPALYVTGEESAQQVAERAIRLQLDRDTLNLLCETRVERILDVAREEKPQILIIDSIQTLYSDEVTSAPGSVSQVRECTAKLVTFAKTTNTVVFLVGHVNKEGHLAGPKVLEHMIDTSLMLEGDGDGRYRCLRSHKNRFGAVNELGVFVMTDKGLREVTNPSALFLSRPEQPSPGTIVSTIWEGTRPLLVEIQALVDENSYGQPRRVSVGVDLNRLTLILAILHRHGNLTIGGHDVFVNLVGGLRSQDTSLDLGLIASLCASFWQKSLPQNLVVFGEVGLTGEIRPVLNGQTRVLEASKHGFKTAIVPKGNAPKKPIDGIRVLAAETVREAVDLLQELRLEGHG